MNEIADCIFPAISGGVIVPDGIGIADEPCFKVAHCYSVVYILRCIESCNGEEDVEGMKWRVERSAYPLIDPLYI